MGFGDIHGRARVRPRSPTAFATCDECGFIYNLDDLRPQYEWSGSVLQNLNYLVCRECNDIPQDQLRSIILPPDPVPRIPNRPENFQADDGWGGFTMYLIGPPVPYTKADVLDQVASLSGIPTPGGVIDRSTTITVANQAQQIMAAGARTWLLLFNPAVNPYQLAKAATVTLGGLNNIQIGYGEALFWADAQGGAATWAGALAAIGLSAGSPVWAWEAP